MEIKIVFEIEEGSKKIIDNFSKAITQLGSATIQNATGTIINQITEFKNFGDEEENYASQEETIKGGDVEETKPVEETDTAPEVPKAKVPAFSFADIQKAAAEVANTKGNAALKELLDKYGAPKLSAIPEEKYGEFVEDLRGLGARI